MAALFREPLTSAVVLLLLLCGCQCARISSLEDVTQGQSHEDVTAGDDNVTAIPAAAAAAPESNGRVVDAALAAEDDDVAGGKFGVNGSDDSVRVTTISAKSEDPDVATSPPIAIASDVATTHAEIDSQVRDGSVAPPTENVPAESTRGVGGGDDGDDDDGEDGGDRVLTSEKSKAENIMVDVVGSKILAQSQPEVNEGATSSPRIPVDNDIYADFFDEFYGISENEREEKMETEKSWLPNIDFKTVDVVYDYSYFDTFYGQETKKMESRKNKMDGDIDQVWRETVDKMIEELSDFLDKNNPCILLNKRYDSAVLANGTGGGSFTDVSGVVDDGGSEPTTGGCPPADGVKVSDSSDLKAKTLIEMENRINDVFKFCSKSCSGTGDSNKHERRSVDENATKTTASTATTTTTTTMTTSDKDKINNNGANDGNKDRASGDNTNDNNCNNDSGNKDDRIKIKNDSSSSGGNNDSRITVSTNNNNHRHHQYGLDNHSDEGGRFDSTQRTPPTNVVANNDDDKKDHDSPKQHPSVPHHKETSHYYYHHHPASAQSGDCFNQKAPPSTCIDIMSQESVLSQLCTKMAAIESGNKCVTSQLLANQKKVDDRSALLEAEIANLKNTIGILQRSSTFYAEAPFGSSQVRGYKVKVIQGPGFEPLSGFFTAPYDGAYQITVGYFKRTTSNTDDLINVMLDSKVIFRLHVNGNDEQRMFMTSLQTGQSLWLKTNVDYSNVVAGDGLNHDLVLFGVVLVK